MRKILSKIENKVDPTNVSPHSVFIGKTLILSHSTVVVESIIAEGGFSIVFQVRPTSHASSPNAIINPKQHLALKRILVNNEPDLRMCRLEIEVAKAMSGHKNVITFLDHAVIPQPEGVFEILILMDYCKDNVLRQMNDKISEGFSEAHILKIFCDVCEALARLHHHSPPVIHRDLKVENILLHASGHYVLCDFGSCTYQTIETKCPNIQSLDDEIKKYTTLAYRSPEMVDLYSGKSINTKADIWALGCLLYKLCFFTTPFGDNTLAIHEARFTIPKTSKYTPELHALITYMLQPDPEARPDIYPVSKIAFKLLHDTCNATCPRVARQCPIPNPHKGGDDIDVSTLLDQLVARMLKESATTAPQTTKPSSYGGKQPLDDSIVASVDQGKYQSTTRAPNPSDTPAAYMTSIAPRERPKGRHQSLKDVSNLPHLPALLKPSVDKSIVAHLPSVQVPAPQKNSKDVNKNNSTFAEDYNPPPHAITPESCGDVATKSSAISRSAIDDPVPETTSGSKTREAAAQAQGESNDRTFSPKGWNPFEEDDLPVEGLGEGKSWPGEGLNLYAIEGMSCSSYLGDPYPESPPLFPPLNQTHKSKGSYSSISNVKSRESLIMSLSSSSTPSFTTSASSSCDEEAVATSSCDDMSSISDRNQQHDPLAKPSDSTKAHKRSKGERGARTSHKSSVDAKNPFENIPFKLVLDLPTAPLSSRVSMDNYDQQDPLIVCDQSRGDDRVRNEASDGDGPQTPGNTKTPSHIPILATAPLTTQSQNSKHFRLYIPQSQKSRRNNPTHPRGKGEVPLKFEVMAPDPNSSAQTHPHSAPLPPPTFPPPPAPPAFNFEDSALVDKHISSTHCVRVCVASNQSNDKSNYYSLRWKKPGKGMLNDATFAPKGIEPNVQTVPLTTLVHISTPDLNKSQPKSVQPPERVVQAKSVLSTVHRYEQPHEINNNVMGFKLRPNILRGAAHNSTIYTTLNDESEVCAALQHDVLDREIPDTTEDYDPEYSIDEDHKSVLLPFEGIGSAGGNSSIENLSTTPSISSSRSSSTRKSSVTTGVLSKYIRSPFNSNSALQDSTSQETTGHLGSEFNDSRTFKTRTSVGKNSDPKKWLKPWDQTANASVPAPSSFANSVFCSPTSQEESSCRNNDNLKSFPELSANKRKPDDHLNDKSTNMSPTITRNRFTPSANIFFKNKKDVSAAVNYGFNNDVELLNAE